MAGFRTAGRLLLSGVLAGAAIFALAGLCYPLQLLPLLLFQSIWKLVGLGVVALPLWTSERIDTATGETVFAAPKAGGGPAGSFETATPRYQGPVRVTGALRG